MQINDRNLWEYMLQRDFGSQQVRVYVHHVTDKYMAVEVRVRMGIGGKSQIAVSFTNIDMTIHYNKGTVVKCGVLNLIKDARQAVCIKHLENVKRAQKAMGATKSVKRRKVAAKLRGKK